jgi:SAM-dependent methyltransferase
MKTTVRRRYLMESAEEALRLDLKTDEAAVERQARWAGVAPGMRIADVGCGPGRTSAALLRLAQPGGEVVAIDIAPQRLAYAGEHFAAPGLTLVCRDAREPLDDLGRFDLVWARFLLEYHRADGFALARNLARLVRPGGTLCLIDLDYNCLSHFGLSPRLERTILALMRGLEAEADFDPYAGRKLYSFLYDLGFEQIEVEMSAHHLFYGALRSADDFNWAKKLEAVRSALDFRFDEYPGGYAEFAAEFTAFFSDPRRFTYTPVILCRGRRPA